MGVLFVCLFCFFSNRSLFVVGLYSILWVSRVLGVLGWCALHFFRDFGGFFISLRNICLFEVVFLSFFKHCFKGFLLLPCGCRKRTPKRF